MLWDRRNFALVNLAFKVKLVLTGLCTKEWRGCKKFFECGQGNKIQERKKDCLFGCSLKIGFRPIWPCGLEAGRARESGRQIIWSSNPGLSTNFLCPCYPEEQNDTGMGEPHGREEGMQEGRREGEMG